MDEIAQKANQARSRRGGDFETKIEVLLSTMQKNKKIKRFERKPIIFNGEFNPDFLVEKNNGEIISVDSTTTARTDRLRGKQWDAYGTKLYFRQIKSKKIRSVVVVQDTDTNTNEKSNFRRCKARAKLPHSVLDEVLSVDEMINYFKK